MPPSPLTRLRTWIGTTPDDGDALAVLVDHDDQVEAAALTILRTRYADMVSNPAKWAVVDDYSQDATANLKALAARITALEEVTGEIVPAPGFTVTPICGPGLAR